MNLAQNRMKQQAYQHRSEQSFNVGDWVFLRLQPYKQMSLKNTKKDNKLSPKYYSPYKVLQKIGIMAYKLELPASSQVHPVFHVSYLKNVILSCLGTQYIVYGGFSRIDIYLCYSFFKRGLLSYCLFLLFLYYIWNLIV